MTPKKLICIKIDIVLNKLFVCLKDTTLFLQNKLKEFLIEKFLKKYLTLLIDNAI